MNGCPPTLTMGASFLTLPISPATVARMLDSSLEIVAFVLSYLPTNIQQTTMKSKIIIGIGALAVAVSLAFPFFIHHLIPHWEQTGQIGDSFGILNNLFTALGFAGLLYTLNLQRQEGESNAAAQRNFLAALGKQADALQTAAELNALRSRIDVYDVQIRESLDTKMQTELVNKMKNERHALYVRLDHILDRLSSEASPQSSKS